MDMEQDPLQRRKQERAKKRKAAKRKRILKIGLGALAMLVVGCVVFLLIADPFGFRQQKEIPPSAVIHLAAAGDLTVSDRVVASGGESYDYTKAFLDVGHLLGTADISLLNFEGNLVGAPYGTSYMSAPDHMMETLNDAGVDLIQLANSYSIKTGMSGLADTIFAVQRAGMEPLGVYPDNASFNKSGGYTICTVKGIRIAFVAFTKGMDGMTLPPKNLNCVNLLYEDYDSNYRTVDTKRITSIMNRVNKENPDLIVALVHWGSEFNDAVSPTQEKICKLLLENGADAILGTHPHYLQKMEFDAEKGTFVAYSLGDFFSDATRKGSEYSVVLDLEISQYPDGSTKITNFSYTPIFTVADEEYLRVVRIHDTMHAYDQGYIGKVTESTYNSMKNALERIEARIKGE